MPLPLWYTETIPFAEAVMLTPGQWVALTTLRSLRNTLLLTGGVSLLLASFPRLQVSFLRRECLVGLLLWRANTLVQNLSTALCVGPLGYAIAYLLSGAVPTEPNTYAANVVGPLNLVSSAVRTFFRLVRGGADKIPAVRHNWALQVTFAWNWLPMMKYCKCFGPLARPQSVDGGAAGALAAAKSLQLTPEVLFLSDLTSLVADRLCCLVTAFALPALGVTPSAKPKRRMCVKKCITGTLGAALAYTLFARQLVPRVAAGRWVFVDPARDVVVLQQLITVAADCGFDYLLSRLPYFQRPASLAAFPETPLPPAETPLPPAEAALLEKVKRTYNLRPAHYADVKGLFEGTVMFPALTASQKVTLCTIMWASMRLEQDVMQGNLCAAALQRFSGHLRRYNHELDDAFELHQESSLVLTESLSAPGPRPGAMEEETNFTCSVCLGKLNLTQDVLEIVHCRHKFHAECVAKWLQKSSRCPMCRFDMSTGTSAGEAEGGGGAAAEAADPPDGITLHILAQLDDLGIDVPHTFDFDEWSAVRHYCLRANLSCPAALSLIADATTPNDVSWVDMVSAPLLWFADCYQPMTSIGAAQHLDYV